MFPVGWTFQNLASQSKKRRDKKKQRAKLLYNNVFVKSCAKGYEKHTFCEECWYCFCFVFLRILASYEAKTAKINNFWIFWSITVLIYHLFAVFALSLKDARKPSQPSSGNTESICNSLRSLRVKAEPPTS